MSKMESPGEQLDLIVVDENTTKLKVAKSNALVEAQYELSGKEHKLLLVAMAEIRKDQTSFYEQVFSVQDLAELLDFSKSSAYSELDRLSTGLMRKQVEIRNDQTGGWEKYQWVTKAYCRNGQFGIRFSEELKPFLLGLVGRFTLYELSRVLKMNSNYAIRLYELLKQFERFGKRTFSLDPKMTSKEDWESFPKLMGYNPKSYARFSNLNQRVLSPAISQVEQYTEFRSVNFSVIRYNRKPVALVFSWKTVDTFEDIQEHPLYRDIRALGVTEAACRQAFKEYDEDRIARNLSYTKRAHKDGDVKNPAAYFASALESDFASGQKPLQFEDTFALAAQAKAGAGNAEASPRQAEGIVDAPGKERHQEVRELCTTDNEARRWLSLERALGVQFESFNEFHAEDMRQRQTGTR
ncbi:replication initiation protein [Marinobacter nauticus]|uniref:Initiator RepB protein n=1 Tax=Marinobacter nauticus (strain ATCC 700491 / DSM 11845 / VT8) TaxID=351348 RepID=A1U7R0_MARN8|nr:replication initiation protein [Marinobacter nauticus]ABM21029.1 initiator RepB protein [Marinobacter nauticus VT8]|tara:strand:+ start:1195 stop:2424 length:1230 start_codon:yes stop_codon:yes gene_type:complete